MAKRLTVFLTGVAVATGWAASRQRTREPEPLDLDLLCDPITYLVTYRRLQENLRALRQDLREGIAPSDDALILISDDLVHLNDLHPLGHMAERVSVCQLLAAG